MSWSKLTRGQRDTASGRGEEWVPAMPDRPLAGAVGKEPISRSFCENRKKLRFKGLIKIYFAFFEFFVFKNKLLFCVVLLTVQVEWFSIKIEPVFP